MKTKNLFFVFVVAVSIVLASMTVMASEIASDTTLKVNDDFIAGKVVGITAGETLDLQVAFNAITDEKDVKVKAWIEGYRDDIEMETGRFDVIANRTYTKKLSLAVPLDLDIQDDYKLIIRVAGKNKEDQQSYSLTIQRPSYDVEILSTEFVREVKDGDNVLINVVVKNRGSHKAEDLYLTAKISELGIQKKVYAGDLVAVDCTDNCDKEDAVEKTIVLQIPKGTKSGDYDLTVVATNDDATDTVVDSITVNGAQVKDNVEVLTSQLTQEVQIGGKTIYKIEIVNPTDETKVVTITTPASLQKAGVTVIATPSVVSVPANSAETVEVEVQATDQTTSGTYTVPIQVGSDNQSKEVGITANVVKAKTASTAVNRPLLTTAVVLGLLFVVLVVVLFTTMKKPEKAGEEETAYY